MYCLVAYAHDGVQRFAVDRSEMLIGSSEACDVRLPYPGIANEHARLRTWGDELRIEDLRSRKGIQVNGKRVRQARLEVLDEIRVGSIALLLEDVVPEPGAPRREPAEEPPEEVCITPSRMLEHLAAVSQWVLADSSSSTTLETLVVAVLRDFGGGVLFLFQGEKEQRGIKFVVASEARWLGNGEELLAQVEAAAEGQGLTQPKPSSAFVGHLKEEEVWIAWRSLVALDRPYLFVVALPRFRPVEWSPLMAMGTLADQLILGLVHHVGQYEPIIFGRRPSVDLILAPGLIAGESSSMQKVLEQLRTVLEPPLQVLLRGEPGASKELLARSLHLSGKRRDGPFVFATCRGAAPHQIAADLFGVEIRGKHAPVVREGKLLLADHGTLYLEDVHLLPLDLQDRLMRFVRSGEVVPVDGLETPTVDVRLICSAPGPLEPFVARDQFRIDLAHWLSQFAVDVPALRERREDLPLLIQAAVNRCCHHAGKRIQGITVEALEALSVYSFPGNLPELENIVRRLVYLCPPGQPISAAMLPEEVRLAKVTNLRPKPGEELNLDRLVADCERAAILEALRRTNGNKSAAARALNLSRNGLAMKMNRLGLAS